MKKKKNILLIDFCNFEDYPIGGQLSFAKNLMFLFNNELKLIGITTEKSDPIGKWFKKEINGIQYDFFALAKYDRTKTKHLIPDRIVSFFLIKFHKKEILKFNLPNVFIQRPEILLSVKNFGFKNICYRFPGVENALKFSKYKHARYFANYFDRKFLPSLEIVKSILASADEVAINNMILRSKGKIKNNSVIKFPTRFNDAIFKPLNKYRTRNHLGIDNELIIITTTGRLCWGKGWKFMIDCFAEFNKTISNSLFYFIGEGEDLDKIKDYISIKSLQTKIKILGKKSPGEIASFLNASDLYIMGSFKEGWSTTLVEALACGVPICTTNFSGATEIVTQGVNGFVIENHDVLTFCKKMTEAVKLDRSILPIPSDVKKYAVSTLKTDLLSKWQLI